MSRRQKQRTMQVNVLLGPRSDPATQFVLTPPVVFTLLHDFFNAARLQVFLSLMDALKVRRAELADA